MRRYVPILIAGMALIAAACSDTIAPAKQPSLTRFADRSFSAVVGENEDSNAVVVHFDIPAAGGTIQVGEFTIAFDSNSVCDPITSGYGHDLWLDDCQTVATDFPITARFYVANGKSHVEFLPDIRFHPAKTVTVSVVRVELQGREMTQAELAAYEVWYTLIDGEIRYYIDEVYADPTLTTQFDTLTGQITRRVRHFSGLTVHAGCELFPEDPLCLLP